MTHLIQQPTTVLATGNKHKELAEYVGASTPPEALRPSEPAASIRRYGVARLRLVSQALECFPHQT